MVQTKKRNVAVSPETGPSICTVEWEEQKRILKGLLSWRSTTTLQVPLRRNKPIHYQMIGGAQNCFENDEDLFSRRENGRLLLTTVIVVVLDNGLSKQARVKGIIILVVFIVVVAHAIRSIQN